MHLVITDPSSGEILESRELGDDEVMDARVFAEQYADSCGYGVDTSDGYIPNCSGDFRVEFRPDPNNPVIIWNGQSFYFDHEV